MISDEAVDDFFETKHLYCAMLKHDHQPFIRMGKWVSFIHLSVHPPIQHLFNEHLLNISQCEGHQGVQNMAPSYGKREAILLSELKNS